MIFSRIATQADFDKQMKIWHEELPIEIINIIQSNDVSKAAFELRKRRGIGLYDAKKIVDRFKSLHDAMSDFQEGKQVFVEY